jgi:uncharacterized membrane protein
VAKIYYVGDWSLMLGPLFVESPFQYEYKGTELFNYGHWLKAALESSGEHEVTSVPSWDFYRLAPGAYEKILSDYDLLIFSDVEARLFQLAPEFFDRSKFGTGKPLTFPDRIRLTIKAVHGGKGIFFLGGWLSFNGELGKGGWGRTALKEILPVTCLDYEDLCESTEGFTAQSSASSHSIGFAPQPPAADHALLRGIDLTTLPPILGYNVVRPREGCPVVAQWQPTGDPMLAVGEFGRGRVLAYTSDPAPHWGCNFVYWEQFAAFWLNACRWVLRAA